LTAAQSLSVVSLLIGSLHAAGDTQGQGQVSRPTADERIVCETAKVRLQAGMADAFRDFEASPVPRSIQVLVEVDGRLRALLAGRLSYRLCGDDREIYDIAWKQMGVQRGYWNELVYSGQLLVDAHARDPHSALRPYTLFSTVFGTTPYHGLGVMPDLSAAFAYATEFSNGPFTTKVYRTIADFHKDLFMVLRDSLSDYKFDCYKKYIGADARQRQKDRAKRVALEYYRRVLDRSPGDDVAKRFADELEREVVKGWSSCAD
jgi:hypothetical protein